MPGWAYVSCSGGPYALAGGQGPTGSLQFHTGSRGISGSANLIYLTASSDLFLTGNMLVSGNVLVSGTIRALNYDVVNHTITYLSSSGDSNFGDTDDDLHAFTGSVVVRESGGGASVFSVDVPNSHITLGAQCTDRIYSSGSLTASCGIKVSGTLNLCPDGVLQVDTILACSPLTISGSQITISSSATTISGNLWLCNGTASLSNLSGCSPITVHAPLSSSTYISASTYYGDGSNLTGVTASAVSVADGPEFSIQFRRDAPVSGEISGSAALMFDTTSSLLVVTGAVAISGTTDGVLFRVDHPNSGTILFVTGNLAGFPGAVGIGLDNPAYALDINGYVSMGNGSGTGYLISRGDTNTYLHFGQGGSDSMEFVAGGRSLLKLDENGTDKVVLGDAATDFVVVSGSLLVSGALNVCQGTASIAHLSGCSDITVYSPIVSVDGMVNITNPTSPVGLAEGSLAALYLSGSQSGSDGSGNHLLSAIVFGDPEADVVGSIMASYDPDEEVSTLQMRVSGSGSTGLNFLHLHAEGARGESSIFMGDSEIALSTREILFEGGEVLGTNDAEDITLHIIMESGSISGSGQLQGRSINTDSGGINSDGNGNLAVGATLTAARISASAEVSASAFYINDSNNSLTWTGAHFSILAAGSGMHISADAGSILLQGNIDIDGDGILSSSTKISASAFYGDGAALTNLPAGNPAGVNEQVQFNDGGTAFGGDTSFTWNKTTNILSLCPSGTLSANNLSGCSPINVLVPLQMQSGDSFSFNGSTNTAKITNIGSNLNINAPGSIILSAGDNNVTSSANISASAFYGDGSNLTNLPGGGSGGIFTTLASGDAYTTSSIRVGSTGEPSASIYVSASVAGPLFRIDTVGNPIGHQTVLYVTSSGRVGIGTTTPARYLEVEDTSSALMQFDCTSRRPWSVGANTDGFIIYDDTANAHRVVISDDAATLGNVGIGVDPATQDPQATLHVSSSVSGDLLQVDDTVAGTIFHISGSGVVTVSGSLNVCNGTASISNLSGCSDITVHSPIVSTNGILNITNTTSPVGLEDGSLAVLYLSGSESGSDGSGNHLLSSITFGAPDSRDAYILVGYDGDEEASSMQIVVSGSGTTGHQAIFLTTMGPNGESGLDLTDRGIGLLAGRVSVQGDGFDPQFIVTNADGDTSLHVSGNNGNIVTAAGAMAGIGTMAPNVTLEVHYTGSGNPINLGGDKGGGEVVYFGTGSLQPGALYYLNSSGGWASGSAAATGSGHNQLLGIAKGPNPAANGVLIKGFFDAASYYAGSFIKGGPVYVGVTNGHMSGTAPTGSDMYVRVVGYGTDTANVIYFNPDSTYVELA